MATQKAINANVQRPNGGIVIPCNSTVPSTSPVTDTAFRKAMAPSGTVARTTSKDGDDTSEILSAGNYGNENTNIIAGYTNTIAGGVAHTLLNHMGPTQFALRRIHSQPSESFALVPSGIRNGYWNIYSGIFNTTLHNITTTWSRDDAIVHPSGYGVGSAEVVYSLGRTPIKQAVAPKTIY